MHKSGSFFRAASVALIVLDATLAFGVERHWRGTTSASASLDANWYEGAKPVGGDDIVLDTDSADKPMTWDIDDVAVGSWTQTNYAGTVTFQTGRDGYNSGAALVRAYGVLAADGTNREFVVTGDLRLCSGVWRHTANPAFATSASVPQSFVSCTNGLGVYRLLVRVDGDCMIGTGAHVNVSSIGYVNGSGPGYGGLYNSAARMGASHGGGGAIAASGVTHCYGSARAPVCLGSGSSSKGGGCFVLSVGKALELDGRITADAENSTGYYSGAGGSVYIQAKTLAGAGSVTANGGAVVNTHGGGGGRIAVVLSDGDFSSFTGSLRANHRKTPGACGAGGTVYMEAGADGVGRGTLVVDGMKTEDTAALTATSRTAYTGWTAEDAAFKPRKIVFRDRAVLGAPAGIVCDLAETELDTTTYSDYAHTIRLHGGTIVFKDGEAIGCNLNSYAAGGVLRAGLSGGGVLRLAGGCTFTSDFATTLQGSLELLSGAVITHTANGSSKVYGIDLTVSGAVTNRAGGSISAKGRGHATNTGPGKPNTGTENRGGSHAGIANKESGDICYGSPTCPVTMGSGGMKQPGGGTIRLMIEGELVNDGSIDAEGNSGSYHAGAGGSVWITARSIAGAGRISANGGSVTGYQTPGGGGRVAVWLTDPDADFSDFDESRITACSGAQGTTLYSGAGTVYLKTGAHAADEGTLVIANSNSTATAKYTEIGSDMGTVRVGSLVIRDKGRLLLRGGHRLEAGGSWSNASLFTAESNSDVVLWSTNTAVVTGTNAFHTLACTAGGKTIRFGTAGSRLSILPGGRLTLNGEKGNLLTLEGDAADTDWTLEAGAGSDLSDLRYLDVAHSDASSIAGFLVAIHSVDGGHNSDNWMFTTVQPGDPITWTGGSNTQWADPANWDPVRVPVETDIVTIPAGKTHDPVLSSPLTLNSLTVAAGASLALNGCDLTLTNALTVAGTLNVDGGETIAVEGDLDLGGAVSGAIARLVLAGGNAQTVTVGGNAIQTVSVSKTGGSVAWGDALAADALSCALAAPLAMTFAAGETVSLRELRLDGAVGGAASLTLGSGGDGAWKLKVTDLERVSGVSVSKCDASGGITIHGDAPSIDGGGNANWVFGEDLFVWTGGASGDFGTDANWSGGQAPGAGDRVVIDTAAAVTLGAATEIAQLTLGGGAGAASLAATAALTVSGTVDVRTNGTLSLNAPSAVGNALFVRNGGVVTHKANASTEAYKIDLAVGGNATVEAGGRIDVKAKGYAGGDGPGCSKSNAGSSHGGRASNGNAPDSVKPCYGSIIAPTALGSGATAGYAGGGAVKLFVSGDLRIDGAVDADAQGGRDWYSGSGGSVYVSTRRLLGSGVLRADGGYVTSGHPGGGGRIALYQTAATDLSAFTGRIQAYGGYIYTGSTTTYIPRSSSGTVFIRNAGDTGGTVYLANGNGATDANPFRPLASEFPVTVNGDDPAIFRDIAFHVSASGALVLTGGAKIADLYLGDGAQVRLNDHTLAIRSPTHRNGKGWSESVLIDTGAGGLGRFVWPGGFCLILR